MRVLKATEEHFEAINTMAGRFIDSEFQMDEPFVSSMHMVQMCHDLGVLAVSLQKEQITGFVAGMTMPFVGNPDIKVMAEIAWWVEPEYRRGRSALALMNYLEEQAHLQNCKHLSMFSMVGEHDAEPIYLKRGFELREKTFHKRLIPCQEQLLFSPRPLSLERLSPTNRMKTQRMPGKKLSARPKPLKLPQ